jgi:hypothetical protein
MRWDLRADVYRPAALSMFRPIASTRVAGKTFRTAVVHDYPLT